MKLWSRCHYLSTNKNKEDDTKETSDLIRWQDDQLEKRPIEVKNQLK